MELKKKTSIIIFLFFGIVFTVVETIVYNEFKVFEDELILEKAQRIFDSIDVLYKLSYPPGKSIQDAYSSGLSEFSNNIKKIIQNRYPELKSFHMYDQKGDILFEYGMKETKGFDIFSE